MGRQVVPLERGEGPPLSQVSPINRRHPSHFKDDTSPKVECFPLKERPLLGRRREAKIKAKPYQISVRIR
jgi:hypothetical protein